MIEETDRSDDFVINYAPLELTADGCVPHSEDYVWGSPTAYHKVCQSRVSATYNSYCVGQDNAKSIVILLLLLLLAARLLG